MTVYGDGQQTRSFQYVSDLVCFRTSSPQYILNFIIYKKESKFIHFCIILVQNLFPEKSACSESAQ